MSYTIVLIGAGSAQFGFGTLGDIFQSQALASSRIVLHDIDATSLARVHEAGQAYIDRHNLPFTLEATTSRKRALTGADFCVISIEVGNRFALWEQDWRIPQQFGVRQVYGENGGPGGLFHALRITPPILDICADIETLCPEAWVFNYSNPMSRICTTVCRRFPGLKFVGLCHEIASLKHHLPAILDLPWEQLQTRAGGLNHFSVLVSITRRQNGADLYPQVLERAPAYFDRLPGLPELLEFVTRHGRVPDMTREAAQFPVQSRWPEREIFRVMMQRFGVFPITTDSHFGEYIQWAYDAADHRGITDFYRLYRDHLSQQEAAIEAKVKERVIPIIEGIVTDAGFEEAAVNLPNQGFIPDLPDWLVVEIPAMVSRTGVSGLNPGRYPHRFLGLLQNQVGIHDLTADAILTGSRDAVIAALMVDPVVDRYHSLAPMVDTLLDLQQEFLGYIS